MRHGASRPVVLGLTGGIAAGKSTAATLLRRLGVPVHDADAAARAVMDRDPRIAAALAEAFPELVSPAVFEKSTGTTGPTGDARTSGKGVVARIDRSRLADMVFAEPEALARLEAIVHPAVRALTRAFLREATRRRVPVVALDVPLLFEAGADRLCDAVILVTAPLFLRRARALTRPGMTPARLAGIIARQMPEAEKRRRADFIVESGLGRRHTLNQLAAIVALARGSCPPFGHRARGIAV